MQALSSIYFTLSSPDFAPAALALAALALTS
jgi:hypothetical protein